MDTLFGPRTFSMRIELEKATDDFEELLGLADRRADYRLLPSRWRRALTFSGRTASAEGMTLSVAVEGPVSKEPWGEYIWRILTKEPVFQRS